MKPNHLSLFELILLLIISYFPQINAQFHYDTLAHKTVAPGVTYTKINETTIPWSIDILKIDLRNPFISLESALANERLAGGREKTSSMSARRNLPGHWVVGAVNADFFDLTNGRPTGMQIEQGQVVRAPGGNPHIGFNALKQYFMGTASINATIRKGTTSINIKDFNALRDTNSVIFYNKKYGISTLTDNSGTEVVIRALQSWSANDTLFVVVDSLRSGKGNTSLINLGDNGAVISATGFASGIINSTIFSGDTLKLYIKISPGLPKMTEALGGHPIIVRNGAIANIDTTDPFVYTRHPRTGIGVSADTSFLFLFTVDGRQLISKGMNLTEYATLMISHGVYQGMNFDGGGSTTMVVRNEVKNSSSDVTGERAVSNALLVISNAPTGSINSIEISPKHSKVFLGQQITFTSMAYDEYYNPFPNAQAVYSLSKPSLGTVNSHGVFTAANTPDSGYIIASMGNVKDSAFIVIKGIGYIKISPKYVTTDNTFFIPFKARLYDIDSVEQVIPNQSFHWRCTDTTVGSIDIFGQFKGKNEGNTSVILSYADKADTAFVTVAVIRGFKIIDSLESVVGWSLKGENIDTVNSTLLVETSQHSLGNASLRLHYGFNYQTGLYNYAYLTNDIPIIGLPDSISIDVKSDGFNHRVFFDFLDNANKNVRVFTQKIANNTAIFDEIRGPFPKSSNINYPLTLKKVTLALGSNQIQGEFSEGNIYLDKLKIKYPDPSAIIITSANVPSEYDLSQNYPNPFNPETIINYSIASVPNVGGTVFVELKVYDVLGRECAVIVSEMQKPGNYSISINASTFPGGVYFYQLKAGDYKQTKKMIVCK